MLFHRPISRAATLCVIACALLGATFSGTALATSHVAAARAQGLYYASFGHDEPTIDKVAAAAQSQGRYYASFGHEQPLAALPSPLSGTPWVLLTGLAIALLAAAAGTVEVRRLGVRRRAARVSTSV